MTPSFACARRIAFSILVAAAIAGCAGPRNSVKHQVALKDIVWLEPADEEAVIYLLRAPHDNSVILPIVDGVSVSRLPVDSYVAVRLAAGTHRLTAAKVGAPETKAATLAVDLKGGERRFFYLSTALPNPERMSGAAGAAVGAGFGIIAQVAVTAFIAGAHKQVDDYGTYSWVECEDLDARGMASFSTEMALGTESLGKATTEAKPK
ncbi:hypothetical protein AB4Z46_08010 [Variovorax sp. M-6]|uniref:hypothetical protein n=1 Tax=Variovorax sp. M-6 TaxID=3233041 RepID=UPI003F997FBB